MEIYVEQEYYLFDDVRDALYDYSFCREFEDENYKKATKPSNLSYFSGYKEVLAVGIYKTESSPGVVALLKDSFAFSNSSMFSRNQGTIKYEEVQEMSIIAPNTTKKSISGFIFGGTLIFFLKNGEKIAFSIPKFDSIYILSKIGNLSPDARFPFYLVSYDDNRYVFLNKNI